MNTKTGDTRLPQQAQPNCGWCEAETAFVTLRVKGVPVPHMARVPRWEKCRQRSQAGHRTCHQHRRLEGRQ